MANRNFEKGIMHTEPGLTAVYCKATFAADAEADGATVNEGTGYVASLTRTGEGVFTIDLSDKYVRLLGFNYVGSLLTHTCHLTSEDVDATSPIVTITFANQDGSPAANDPDSGVYYFWLYLKNSSVD